MALLGSLHKYGRGGSWEVNYGDESAGTYSRDTFLVKEYGTSAKAKKAARDWQKSQQGKWEKIVADREKGSKEVIKKYKTFIKNFKKDYGGLPNVSQIAQGTDSSDATLVKYLKE